MKVQILAVFCCLVAAAFAQQTKEPVPILSLENTVNHDGSYVYGYESGDGTKAQQSGKLKVVGPEPDKAGEVAEGSVSYVGDDGKTYSLTYVADENGYQPQGEHLPVAPEIPPAIVKALAYLATAPPPKEQTGRK